MNKNEIKSDDEILSRYQKMTHDKDCDPILVQAEITLLNFTNSTTGKVSQKKSIQVKCLPIIVTPDRYLELYKEHNSEFWDMGRGIYQKIFWFKPTTHMTGTFDLFDANIEEIYAFFNKVKNVKTQTNEKGGIILP